MFLLQVKLITQGEKRETSNKTCNETMLHDKLGVFVSHISPLLITQELQYIKVYGQSSGIVLLLNKLARMQTT